LEVSGLELSRLLYEAFLARDLDAFLSHLDEEVEWSPGAFLTGTATYHGKEGVRRWWEEVETLRTERGETLLIEFDEDRELPDGRVVRFGRARIVRALGELRTEFAVVFALTDGRVSAVEGFTSHAEARERLGLGP
jgi:ketosteroid isomerase-like protein